MEDSSKKSNPQEAKEVLPNAGHMTPFGRMKLQQAEKEAQLYLDFCEFAALWLQPTGCVQKHMVVLYFRENFENHKYKYSSTAEDVEIEDAFDKWNQEEGPKAEANEFGLYLGLQINTEYEREVREKEHLERRKTQIKLVIADCKRQGVKPPLEILKDAMELGVIQVPKATLESMKAVSARPHRRVSIAVPHKQHPGDSPKQSKKSKLHSSAGVLDLKKAERKDKKSSSKKSSSKDSDRKSSSKSSSKLHKSMGNLDYKSSSRKSDDKKDKKKSSSRDKDRLGKSMGDLDYHKSRKSSSKDDKKEHKSSSSSKDKDKKSSSKGEDKDRKSSKSSSSRLHKSMGNLDFKEKDRKSSSSKDKDKKEHKSSSSSKDKDKKSSSKDKDKDRKSSKSSSSRLHKSMGNLDFKEKNRKSSSSKDKDKDKDKKSSSNDKDKKSSSKDEDKKSSSKDKEEKKSSSRKSSRRGSH